jgi:hypothetical protein
MKKLPASNLAKFKDALDYIATHPRTRMKEDPGDAYTKGLIDGYRACAFIAMIGLGLEDEGIKK